jgi:hypothetical protein
MERWTLHHDRITRPHDSVCAHALWNNPLGDAPAPPAPSDLPIARWTGWLGGPRTLDDGTFEANFRTWTPAGRERFDQWIEHARRTDAGIWLRPHARHVISDVQTSLSLLRAWEDTGPGPQIGRAHV